MKTLIENDLSVSEVSTYLGLPYEGEDCNITKIELNPAVAENGALIVIREKYKSLGLCQVNEGKLAIISDVDNAELRKFYPNSSLIKTEDSKFLFFKVINEFFTSEKPHSISANAIISESAEIANNVNIGSHSVIGPNSKISHDVVIEENVVIGSNVSIGPRSVIKAGAVIGTNCFEFATSNDESLSIPCTGKIIIRDSVHIGSNTTIETPSISTTEIESNSKIDDLVHIGDSCHIGENCMIAAGSILGRRVDLGKNVLIGMRSVLRSDIKIKSDSRISMGTIVTHSN